MPIKVKHNKRWRRALNATMRRDDRSDAAEYKRKREEFFSYE